MQHAFVVPFCGSDAPAGSGGVECEADAQLVRFARHRLHTQTALLEIHRVADCGRLCQLLRRHLRLGLLLLHVSRLLLLSLLQCQSLDQ